jgi:hypothetical protein
MIDYYRMEAVRDLVAEKYGKEDIKTDHENPVPLPTWNRYPSCPVLKICRKVSCTGFVSINVNTEIVRWLYLEIWFFRERQRAFIRVDNPQMLKLFELEIINAGSLKGSIETF